MQFPAAMHLSALNPGLPDEFDLTNVFPDPLAQRILTPSIYTFLAPRTAHNVGRRTGMPHGILSEIRIGFYSV